MVRSRSHGADPVNHDGSAPAVSSAAQFTSERFRPGGDTDAVDDCIDRLRERLPAYERGAAPFG